MESTTVVVIGCGVLGLATAEAVSSRGLEVLVLEKETIASGVTGRSVGVVETQYLNEEDIALRARAMEGFARLINDHGLEFTRTGYLRLGRSADDLAAFERSKGVQESYGIGGVEVLEPAEIARVVPDLELAGITGGLWGANDGFVDPHHLCSVLAGSVRRNGGRIWQQAEVVGHESSRPGEHVVMTRRGEIRAEVVVNAAGAEAGRVAAILGQDLEVVAEQHRVLHVWVGAGRAAGLPSVVDYVPGGAMEGFWLRRDTVDTVFSGLHVESRGEEAHEPDDEASFVDRWAARLLKLFPGWDSAELAGSWTGAYPTADGGPIAGPLSDDPTIVTVAGGGGYGLQIAPALGATVADLIA